MKHHTKEKGDTAVFNVMADLRSKGFYIFTTICEHLPFDLIVYQNQKTYRIQVKFTSEGFIENKTSWTDKNGSHSKIYNKNDFDYYAIFLPKINKVIYPSIIFGGITIRTELPNCYTSFYWYEDFLEFTDNAIKKSYKDFGIIPKMNNRKPRPSTRKVTRPYKDELEKLVWSKPTSTIAKEFGVSDNAITKWCKNYNITKPSRGYWSSR